MLEWVRITQNQIADLIQQNKYKLYKKIAIFQHLGCITQFYSPFNALSGRPTRKYHYAQYNGVWVVTERQLLGF